jgi:hypothetical protein
MPVIESKTGDDYTMACIRCGADRSLQMWPHRNKHGHLVGWVLACGNCGSHMPYSEIIIKQQEAHDEVVRGD